MDSEEEHNKEQTDISPIAAPGPSPTVEDTVQFLLSQPHHTLRECGLDSTNLAAAFESVLAYEGGAFDDNVDVVTASATEASTTTDHSNHVPPPPPPAPTLTNIAEDDTMEDSDLPVLLDSLFLNEG